MHVLIVDSYSLRNSNHQGLHKPGDGNSWIIFSDDFARIGNTMSYSLLSSSFKTDIFSMIRGVQSFVHSPQQRCSIFVITRFKEIATGNRFIVIPIYDRLQLSDPLSIC